jgi:hypothetical protein
MEAVLPCKRFLFANNIFDCDILIHISDYMVNDFYVIFTVLLTFEHQSSNIMTFMSYEVTEKKRSERTELRS